MKSTPWQISSRGAFPTASQTPLKSAVEFIVPILLPLLFGIVPTLYHYSNNVEKLILANLWRMLIFSELLVFVFYIFIAAFIRFRAYETAVMTCIFLIFFNVYGLAYRYLLNIDIIRLKHYTFLPFMLMLAIYMMYPVLKLPKPAAVNIWKNLVLITGLLVLYNVLPIISAEVKRWGNERNSGIQDLPESLFIQEDAPDIYFIILDEFAGFQAMREYWQYGEVESFVNFLKDKGFFVAEESHGNTIDTLHEIATRLNYKTYPSGGAAIQIYFDDIADNQVMRFLQSRGYTTIVFDETNMGYPSAKPIQADYLYEYGSSSIPTERGGAYELYFDEFGELVTDNTMLYAFAQEYKANSPRINQHRNMIYFTVDNIANRKFPSPKFVYVHLLLPHMPFVFDLNGNIVDYDRFADWNSYLENYIFSITIAESMINEILSEADPDHPPMIILQSDHGARNILAHDGSGITLPNYPEDFKTLILFALYLPGQDYAKLPQNINPINTFPIIFNQFFDAKIDLVK